MLARALPCPNCGCGPVCEIASDDFNRANSTSIGSKLSEETGDASIASNRLAMPSTGVVQSTDDGPAPSGTDGHKVNWTIAFGSTISVARYCRIHVDVVDNSNSYYAEIKPVIGSPNKIRIELFDLSSGSPSSIAGPDEIEDINDNIANDQYVCVSIDGSTLRANINAHTLEVAITPKGGTKTRLETVNTVNFNADEYTFSRISIADECDPCQDMGTNQECEACENSTPANAAPNFLVATLASLIDYYQECNPPCASGVDCTTYDCPALDGTVLLPFVGCTVLDSGVDSFDCSGPLQCHSYALYSNRVDISNGLLEICESGIPVDPADQENVAVVIDVLLVKLAGGGYKIWGEISTGAIGSEHSLWEAAFDGDCMGISTSPTSMTKICEAATTASGIRTCDHASLTFTVRRP